MVRKALVLAALLAACGGSAPQAGDPGDPFAEQPGEEALVSGGTDWPQYRHDTFSDSNNTGGSFTTAQAAAVTPLWTAELGAQGFSQPIIVGSTVYATLGFSAKVVALNAATGTVRWTRAFPHPLTDPCTTKVAKTGIWAAPAVVGGVVYVASPDGHLYALSASSGATLWSAVIANPAAHAEFVQSSPAVANGKVYLGVSSTFDCSPISGRILAVDVAAPHAVHTRSLTAGGLSGTPVWSSLSYDPAANVLFASTGDTAGHTLAAEPLAQSLVSFNASTLAPIDHWQDPGPPPSADSDFGSSPLVFHASDGTQLVAAANKDGFLYALRRGSLHLGPLWKVQLAVGGSPENGFGSIVSPSFGNGLVYAAGGRTPAGRPGSVLGLDPKTGAVRFTHLTPGYVIASMPVMGDVLAVESTSTSNSSSTLELLNAHTGAVLKSFSDPAVPTYAAPVMGRSLVLWITFSGRLRAYRIH